MTTEFDEVLQQGYAALDQIARGDPSGYKALYSRREDITLGNPFGGFVRGWDEVAERLEGAASYYADGRATTFDIITKAVTPDLAYTVAIEGIEAKVAGRPGSCVNSRASDVRLSPRGKQLETGPPPCRPEGRAPSR